MKINNKEFKKFIAKANLNGLNNKFIIKFEEEGLKVDLRNEANTIGVSGLLKKEIIQGYTPIGTIAIKRVDILLGMLGKFSSEFITIDFEKNNDGDYSRLIIKDENTKYRHILSPNSDIEEFTPIKFDSIPFDDSANVDMSIIKETLSASSQIGGIEKISIKASNKTMLFLIDNNDNEFEKELTINEKLSKDYYFLMPQTFFEVVKTIDGIFSMRLNTETEVPIVIINEEENSSFKFAVAKRDFD